PPRATDLPPCPDTSDPDRPCAKTVLVAGDRVRVEWWVDVLSIGARSFNLGLEAPGSSAASFPLLAPTRELLAGAPTAVRVTHFSARRDGGAVDVSWLLDVPAGVSGLRLERGPGPDGPWQQVGGTIVPV